MADHDSGVRGVRQSQASFEAQVSSQGQGHRLFGYHSGMRIRVVGGAVQWSC